MSCLCQQQMCCCVRHVATHLLHFCLALSAQSPQMILHFKYHTSRNRAKERYQRSAATARARRADGPMTQHAPRDHRRFTAASPRRSLNASHRTSRFNCLNLSPGGASFANPYGGEERVDLGQVWVDIPSSLVALGGDVHITVRGAPAAAAAALRVRLAREDDGRALLATMPLALDAESRMTLPCGYFSRGGTYYLELVAEGEHLPAEDYEADATERTTEEGERVRRAADGDTVQTGEGAVKSWQFEVQWPTATLDVTPERIQTYPERAVTAIVEFPRAVCAPLRAGADFWLELLYCGHASGGAVLCDGRNTSSHAHVLYSEQMHAFPGRRTMTLRCELFGQAGDYALTLRPAAPAAPAGSQDLAAAFIKADWSEQFVLNVRGGSVLPCGAGVRVLFQYPECVLERADRVRVFGRDRDRLRYVAERRVTRGQHTASFDCRLFSERFPEYCFVYVSQAVTGAVADVRMDCLPTLPLSEGGAGAWGAWSAWSACPAPAHCSTRTRSRHRFCDSPPPAYGAKYCESEIMPPKKEKGKKQKQEEAPAAPTVTETEKTFFELEIADCNRKVARLRASIEEYEIRNEELQKAYDKLDEDRADIIAYLKKVLNTKNEENVELKEKVKGLEEIREIETANFKKTVSELERNFTVMKEQLTSENKLLAGKLNTLEEFRCIRDDLMRKYEKQEQDFKDQEMKYKRIIYDAEKKFVIGKDKLKKEMEGRLLQLAQDFQDATELRVAASTHRVIRENIAINNELDNILSAQSKLTDLNEKYRESERNARISMELAEEERDKAINRSIVQKKVIDQLTAAFQNINKEKALFEKRNYDFETLQAKIQKLTKENENQLLQIRILEQNLHAKMTDENKSIVETSKVNKENAKLKKILKEAATAIQAALKLDEWATTDKSRDIMNRELLLSRLLSIINQYRELHKADSTDTFASLSKIYEEGDLGFVPKPSSKKSMGSTVALTSSRETLPAEKESALSMAVSTSTIGSIKTIPSMKLVPPSSAQDVTVKQSVASFVTSSHSSDTSRSSEEEKEEESDDIEAQLVKSKLEIQKSIMKDLASQRRLSSRARLSEEKQKALMSKSVIFEEKEDESVEGEGKSQVGDSETATGEAEGEGEGLEGPGQEEQPPDGDKDEEQHKEEEPK
ncbi:Uncharacterized protein C9orf117-like [Papilio machaon]|uniref:Cilia- and flagella-associated protein 157 n=1 Tax=Papilio machaon TaxID=76193 RepID=A0A194RFF8_PAPMA|nr:Uncharacterized protein C9orf117-like [Papilio machaon]